MLGVKRVPHRYGRLKSPGLGHTLLTLVFDIIRKQRLNHSGKIVGQGSYLDNQVFIQGQIYWALP